MQYLKRLRDAVVAVALVLAPFFFLRTHLKNPENLNSLDRMLIKVSAPIQYVAKESASSLSEIVEDYFYFVDVKKENHYLKDEISSLRQENRELRFKQKENKRLKDLLELRRKYPQEPMTARVIAKEINNFFRIQRIKIDRGQIDKVQPGMPVVASDGLVGQIRDVTKEYADVQLLVDRYSKIDVVIKRNGARGILRGKGEEKNYACQIQFLNESDKVDIGDEVYTSGFGKRFPEGILVGHVSQIHASEKQLYQVVNVEPSVNFSKLSNLIILPKNTLELPGK